MGKPDRTFGVGHLKALNSGTVAFGPAVMRGGKRLSDTRVVGCDAVEAGRASGVAWRKDAVTSG